jgi:PKD repeat protein
MWWPSAEVILVVVTETLSRCIRPQRLSAAAAALAAACAVSLAAASQASAAHFCVSTSSCVAGTVKPSLEQAIDDSEFNGQADLITIGPSATPHVGDFSSQSGERLTIDGAGQDETVLEPDAASLTTLSLYGNPDSSVSDLTLRVKNQAGARGLYLQKGTATGVRIEQASSETDLAGADLDNATFEQGVVDMDGGKAFEIDKPGSHSTVRDSQVRAWGGVETLADASLTLSRSRITSQRVAITTGGTGGVTIDDSVLHRTSAAAFDCTVLALSGSVVAQHVTVVGPDSGYGVCSWAYGAWDTTVTVANSIVRGHQHDFSRAGDPSRTATLGIQYSNYATVLDDATAGGGLTQGAGNITDVAPQFVNPVFGDYRVKAPSPLIDAGDPSDALALDLAGRPRVVEGDGAPGKRSDMGAYEYQRQAPTALFTVPASALAGEAVQVSATGSSDPDPGDSLSYSWDFGDGTTASTANSTHIFQSGGDYAVKLTVTDPTGLQATATKTIDVSAPPTTPGDPSSGGSAPGTTPPAGTASPASPTPTAGGDTTAPRVSGLSVAPERLRLGRALPALASTGLKRGAIRLRLSENATVELTFKKVTVGRNVGRRCVKETSANRAARRCTRLTTVPGRVRIAAPSGSPRIRFQGRLSRTRALRPGRYQVLVAATDRAGNATRPQSAGFTVLRARG